jgi:uncharacterized protein YhaN
VRSQDNFLHPYDQLRVGARLRLADGSELALVRRKGRRATLRGPDDETPLDDGTLDRCLQGIDEALFSSLFGLDHQALVAGGVELLAQRGDVGQALFAAGLGTRSLRRVLDGLDAEAHALFLQRGSKPQINQRIAAHREAKKASLELSLSGRDWDDKRREVAAKRERSAGLETELAAMKAERNRLQRIRRVQPRLAERRDLLLRRDELGDVVPLSARFGERLRETRAAQLAAVEAGGRAAAELGEVAEERAALTVPGAVLEQAETIERLHQGVERFTKGVADRSRLLVERGDLRAAAVDLLDNLQPGLTLEEAATRRPALARWLRIQELGNERQALWNRAELAAAAAAAAARELAAAGEALAALAVPRDPAALRRRLAAARRHGDLDRALAEAAGSLARMEEELRLDLARLGLFRGSPEAAEALPVPAEETLRRFQDDFDGLAARRQALVERQAALRTDLADAERRLDEIHRGGAVPTEAEMLAARARRDELWASWRRAWAAGDRGGVGGADPALYERSVGAADDLADRLRREAGRVQEQARLLARQEELRGLAAAAEADAARTAADGKQLDADWRALWKPCGIAPLPPREMHPGWTRRHEKLRAQTAALRAERHRLAGLAAGRAEHRAAIAREIAAVAAPAPAPAPAAARAAAASARAAPPPRSSATPRPDAEALEPLLAAGEERVRDLEREAEERERITKAVGEAKERLAEARAAASSADAARDSWQQAWGEEVQDLGLDREAMPSHALQVVDTLRRAFASLGDADKLDRRVAGLDRDLGIYRDSVRALAAQIAPDLVELPPEQAAVQLQALLTAARRSAGRRQDLDRRAAKLEEEARFAAAARRARELELAELVDEAGCADAAGLDEAERRSTQLLELGRDLERGERQLREDGDGLAIGELESEAAEVDADALPGRSEQLDRDIVEIEARALDLREELGRAQQELSRMTGGEAAVREAERAQEILAGLRESVERYVHVRLAGTVLRQEIERYRAQNQDPLLRRAGEHFAALSLGRYTGLRSDFDDRDEAVLEACRPDGQRVGVGGMSEGTRDQLYLALRLATLERHLAHAEPLPFIVDDVLVNFDDPRSKRTLEILADVSARTQVILFTHHAHVRDLALGVSNGAGVFVSEL